MPQSADSEMRAYNPETLQELCRTIQYIFPGTDPKPINADESNALLQQAPQPSEATRAYWQSNLNRLVLTLNSSESSQDVVGGCTVELSDEPEAIDLLFVRSFLRVFSHDLSTCMELKKTEELWADVRRSQFPRAIARTVGFPVHPASSWIRVMESSMSLMYEGRPVRHIVIMPRDFPEFCAPIEKEGAFRRFRHPLSFSAGLLGEKWMRAVVDGSRVALVGSKREGGQLKGFVTLADSRRDVEEYAPHESLLPVLGIMGVQDMALVASPNGDLWIISGRGVAWKKTQGRWHYLNYRNLHRSLQRSVKNPGLVRDLLRACIDLSYERRGALFVVLDKAPEGDAAALISDWAQRERSNSELRLALRRASIRKWQQRQIIAAAAGTDGATVLSHTGYVVDIACMIRDPTNETLGKFNVHRPRSFSGARSRAAWAASLQGTAIKVSEDGPITIWRHGQVVAEIG